VLRNLKNISEKAKKIDIENHFEPIKIIGHPEDEINIMADTINKSFLKIQNQTSTLKQFITDVSHEFKTPIMVINSEIDVYNKKLEKNELGEQDIQKLFEKIKEKTNKLNKLLETFLLLSRIENNIEHLNKKEIDL
jgi:signal transduction histidine kinase